MNYDSITELYEQQYLSYREDLHFYRRMAQTLGGPLLELGCGTGRLTLPLARAGNEIVGLELSPKMLQKAQEKAREKAVAEGLNLELILGDMRTFALERRFKTVLIPFNALMHLYTLGDQAAALGRVHHHLEPNGNLLFDVYVPRFGLEGVLRHEGETFFAEHGSRTDVWVLQRIDPIKQMAYTEYFVDTTQSSGMITRQHLMLEQRYFTRFELEWMLRASGFEVLKVWGSFEGEPLENSSHYMIFQARKLG